MTIRSDHHPAPAPDDVLRAYLDALVAGNIEAIAGYFAEDATWTVHGTLPLSGTKTGRAAILEFLTGAGALFQPGRQSFSFGTLTAQEDRVVLEWTVRGVTVATGLPYDNDYCAVFVIRSGLIVQVREYLDSLHAAEVLFTQRTQDQDRTADTKATVRRFLDALTNGDSESMRALLAPDATWWLSGELPTSGTWTGPDQILDQFLAAMFARLDPHAPITQELHRIIAEDDLAVAEWTSAATTTVQTAYTNDYAVVFRVSAGQILEVREYFDTGYAERVMFAHG